MVDLSSTAVQDEVLIKAEIEDLARSVKSQALQLSIQAAETSNGTRVKENCSQPEKENASCTENWNGNWPEKENGNQPEIEQHVAKRSMKSSQGSVVELSP